MTSKTIIKWFFIVALNTISGWYWGLEINDSQAWINGMIMGVLAWWMIYCACDTYFLKRGKKKDSKYLTIATIIKALLQGVIFIDLFVGMIVTTFLELFGLSIDISSDFYTSLYITLGVGLVYSFIVLILFGLIKLVAALLAKRKIRKSALSKK